MTDLPMSPPRFIRCGKAFINIDDDSIHSRLLNGIASIIEVVLHEDLNNRIRHVLLEKRIRATSIQ